MSLKKQSCEKSVEYENLAKTVFRNFISMSFFIAKNNYNFLLLNSVI